jgi:hypothetical protein
LTTGLKRTASSGSLWAVVCLLQNTMNNVSFLPRRVQITAHFPRENRGHFSARAHVSPRTRLRSRRCMITGGCAALHTRQFTFSRSAARIGLFAFCRCAVQIALVRIVQKTAAERRKSNSQGWSGAQLLAASRKKGKPRSGAMRFMAGIVRCIEPRFRGADAGIHRAAIPCDDVRPDLGYTR